MKTKIVLSFMTIAFLGLANASFAQESKFDKNHPRRAEVNGRLANQDARIDKKEEAGKMSVAEADKLHAKDNSVRNEEKRMAKKDDGHITKADQRRLNRRENHISRQIKRH